MKKYIAGGVIIAALVLYLILSNQNTAPTVVSDKQQQATSSTTIASGTNGYKDGTYTGPVADAIYGNLQVVAVISGGRLTDVQWPVYPDDPGHTSTVSANALPQLRQEALQAQNANVNVVSGATQTSEAFQQSLGAALTDAKN